MNLKYYEYDPSKKFCATAPTTTTLFCARKNPAHCIRRMYLSIDVLCVIYIRCLYGPPVHFFLKKKILSHYHKLQLFTTKHELFNYFFCLNFCWIQSKTCLAVHSHVLNHDYCSIEIHINRYLKYKHCLDINKKHIKHAIPN